MLLKGFAYEIEIKKAKRKPITLEVILQNERLKRGWNYKHLAEQLALPNITAKNVKKWEYSFEYPDLKTIYRISELYQIPSEILVQAKNNAMVIFSYIFLYILLPLAGVGAIFLFASKIAI